MQPTISTLPQVEPPSAPSTLTVPDLDALLTRAATAAALTAAGFPVKAATLATKATRGGGPRYRHFGSRVLYNWRDALDWAQSRLGESRGSTSESDIEVMTVAVSPNRKTEAASSNTAASIVASTEVTTRNRRRAKKSGSRP